MKSKFLSLLISIIGIYGCSENKFFLKDNTVYQMRMIETSGDSIKYPTRTFQLKTVNFHSIASGTIKDNGDNVIITLKNLGLADSTITGIDLEKHPRLNLDNLGKYYFPESQLVPDSAIISKLKYLDIKPVLQGLTFPLKIRPKLTSPSLLDSFPQTVETAFSAALALGWKLSYNVFDSKENPWGQYTNSYSFMPGIFLGVGAEDLEKTNTRNPVITFGTKAATISYGLFFVVGYNRINLGYGLGWDHAFGEGSSSWLYQNKLWHGITVGVDIIK